MIAKVCELCGQPFDTYPSEAARRFCSLKCKGEASRVERTVKWCPVCGVRMARKRKSSRLETNAQFEQRSTCSLACGRELARVGRQRPWRVGRRRLLARSCDRCGAFQQGEAYNKSGDGSRGRTCAACRNAALSDEQRAKGLERGAKYLADQQCATLATAAKHGQLWTTAEMEDVIRDDLTTTQIATALGRTYAAVKMRRRMCLTDPKWITAVGVGRS